MNDENQAIRLYILADKYLQEDLREKCLNFLTSIINMDNVYKILDFGHQENVSQIKIWCMKLFQDRITIDNVAELISYLLDLQEDSEFKENNKAFRNFALNFVLERFLEISQNEKGNMQRYEKFILKNIELETVSALAIFLARFNELPENEKFFVARIREAVFNFVQENVENIMMSEIAKTFPIGFFTDFTLYLASQIPKSLKKRMEPVQDDDEEENQTLKKTKKFDKAYEK